MFENQDRIDHLARHFVRRLRVTFPTARAMASLALAMPARRA